MSEDGDRAWSKWTPSELGTLGALLRSGLTNEEIALTMNRPHTGVRRMAVLVGPTVWPNKSNEDIFKIRRRLLDERHQRDRTSKGQFVAKSGRPAATVLSSSPRGRIPAMPSGLPPRRCLGADCGQRFTPTHRGNFICPDCTPRVNRGA